MFVKDEREVITTDHEGIKSIVKNVMNNFIQMTSRT